MCYSPWNLCKGILNKNWVGLCCTVLVHHSFVKEYWMERELRKRIRIYSEFSHGLEIENWSPNSVVHQWLMHNLVVIFLSFYLLFGHLSVRYSWCCTFSIGWFFSYYGGLLICVGWKRLLVLPDNWGLWVVWWLLDIKGFICYYDELLKYSASFRDFMSRVVGIIMIIGCLNGVSSRIWQLDSDLVC